MLPHLPQWTEDSLGPFSLLSFQPSYTWIRSLLRGSVLEIEIAQSHTNNLVAFRVDAFKRVLIITVVPPLERTSRVCLSELRIDRAWKEDLDNEAAHEIILECGEVDIIDPLNVGNERWKYDLHHFDSI